MRLPIPPLNLEGASRQTSPVSERGNSCFPTAFHCLLGPSGVKVLRGGGLAEIDSISISIYACFVLVFLILNLYG
jgi:hypothetical protein